MANYQIGDWVKCMYTYLTTDDGGSSREYEGLVNWVSDKRFGIEGYTGYFEPSFVVEHRFYECGCGNRRHSKDYLCKQCRAELDS